MRLFGRILGGLGLLVGLAAITIFLGIYPRPAIDLLDPDIQEWRKPFVAEIRAGQPETGQAPGEER